MMYDVFFSVYLTLVWMSEGVCTFIFEKMNRRLWISVLFPKSDVFR